MCSDSASRRRTRTSERSHTETFSLSESENRGTRPRFSGICFANSIKTCAKRTKGTPKACLFCVPPRRRARKACAISCRIPAKPEQAGQAHRSAPHKIPQESQGVYLTFLPLPRDTCRGPPLPCRGEGGIPSGFSGTGGVSRGDGVPPRGYAAAYPGYTQGGYAAVFSPSSCAAIPRSA